MAKLLLSLVVAITIVSAVPVTAQENSESTDFVQALIEVDSETTCDEIGWSYLPIEMRENTIDITRQMACHRGVGGTLLAACIEPFIYLGEGYAGGPPPGMAHIHCHVGIQNMEDSTLVVDPEDFFVVGSDTATFPIDVGLMKVLPVGAPLLQSELAFKEAAVSGRLVFSVPDNISRPFVLMWWPDSSSDEDPVGILIDRTVPWDQAAGF